MLRVFFNTERCVGFRTGFATEDSFAERRGRLFIYTQGRHLCLDSRSLEKALPQELG